MYREKHGDHQKARIVVLVWSLSSWVFCALNNQLFCFSAFCSMMCNWAWWTGECRAHNFFFFFHPCVYMYHVLNFPCMLFNIAVLCYYLTLTVLQNCYFQTTELDITVVYAYSHIMYLLELMSFKVYKSIVASAVCVELLILSTTQWRRYYLIL